MYLDERGGTAPKLFKRCDEQRSGSFKMAPVCEHVRTYVFRGASMGVYVKSQIKAASIQANGKVVSPGGGKRGSGVACCWNPFPTKMLLSLHLIREKGGNEGMDRGIKRQRKREGGGKARRKREKIFLYF